MDILPMPCYPKQLAGCVGRIWRVVVPGTGNTPGFLTLDEHGLKIKGACHPALG